MDALGRRLGETDRHVEKLAVELRRVRTVARVLATWLGTDAGEIALDAAALARDAGISVGHAEAAIRDLAARGVGRLDGGRWLLRAPEDVRRLADALVAAP